MSVKGHGQDRKIVYFDCFSGASGDMLLSSLLDAGADIEDVKAALHTIEPIKNEVMNDQ